MYADRVQVMRLWRKQKERALDVYIFFGGAFFFASERRYTRSGERALVATTDGI